MSPSSVKALYRRGTAYIALDDYYNAESDLRHALEVNPGNADVQRRLARMAVLMARQEKRERALYSNLFGRLSRLEEANRRAGVRIGDEPDPPLVDDSQYFDDDDDDAASGSDSMTDDGAGAAEDDEDDDMDDGPPHPASVPAPSG